MLSGDNGLQVFEMKDKIEIMSRLLEGQSALDLVAEQNGNHVIQKCIECIKPASRLQPLVKVCGSEIRVSLNCLLQHGIWATKSIASLPVSLPPIAENLYLK